MPFSTTFAAVLVLLLSGLGLSISQDQAESFVAVLLMFASAAHICRERWLKGDIHWSGVKK